MSWNDFNDAENQSDLIPAGTLAKVIMHIRKGGHNDPNQGWTGDYAKQSNSSAAVYLDCEFTILEGQHAKRKVWDRIGLYSPKGATYANMGRRLVKGILNSSRGLSEKDVSPEAQNKRKINGFADLDGITFIAKIGINKEGDQNEIKAAITADHKDYAAMMQGTGETAGAPVSYGSATPPPPAAAAAPAQPNQPEGNPGAGNRPSWA